MARSVLAVFRDVRGSAMGLLSENTLPAKDNPIDVKFNRTNVLFGIRQRSGRGQQIEPTAERKSTRQPRAVAEGRAQ
jgi:hypothetical protein